MMDLEFLKQLNGGGLVTVVAILVWTIFIIVRWFIKREERKGEKETVNIHLQVIQETSKALSAIQSQNERNDETLKSLVESTSKVNQAVLTMTGIVETGSLTLSKLTDKCEMMEREVAIANALKQKRHNND